MSDGRLWNANYVKVWFGNFLVNLAFLLIVPLLPLYLSETFGADNDQIGLCLAGYTVMALVVRPFSGFLVDSFPRKTVLTVCNFLFFALFFGYIIAGSLTLFTIFRTLHGAPFGAATVSASTVAIDVLPSKRRTEGIGYYGLSNNLSTAIGPVLAIYVLKACDGNFMPLFWLSAFISLLGLIIDASIKLPPRDFVPEKRVVSLDRFFLMKGWREAVIILLFSTCHTLIFTYVAIYGKQELGITSGTGYFFTLFAVGLIFSRLSGARSLRSNKVSRNAVVGILVSFVGYSLFALPLNELAYFLSAFIIGLGNGHWYPAFQNMFVNLAENNQRGTANSSLLTSWDAGSGVGILLGGVISEHFGYTWAFLAAAGFFVAGMLVYFLKTRAHFEKNKLR